jgi:epoxyqueuosine reductase
VTSASVARALESRIRAQGYGLGFDLVGITDLGVAATADAFAAWIARGYAGEMHYMARGVATRRDTRLPVPGATSAVVVGLDYGGRQPSGAVARYARGADYHDVMLDKLGRLHRWIEDDLGESVRGKAYVDTGPVLERDLARRAGLGWFGKNTNLINPGRGSYFFLGALLLDAELAPDAPFEEDRCGRCTRCLDACPTDALVAPGTLDATRCISYLTIELRGSIPEPLREDMGVLIYGCDICQEVCPWNVRFARDLEEPALAPAADLLEPDLAALLLLDDGAFRERFRHSPISRAKRRGLARNVAVAMGNRRNPSDLPALVRAVRDDPEPLVRGHAAWALGRHGTPDALTALMAAAASDVNEAVRGEAARALERALA